MKAKQGYVVLMVVVATFVVVSTLAAAFTISLRLQRANVRMQEELLTVPKPKAEKAQDQQGVRGNIIIHDL